MPRKGRRFTCIYRAENPPSISYMDYRWLFVGRDSSVGIATGYELDGPGARFSAPVQTGTIGTGVFPGVESGRGVTLTSHLLLVPRYKTE
jgi:hypothetical protein